MADNALIVEVVGDTSKLTASLAKADKDLNRFAGRASSWDKRTPQSGPAGPLLKQIDQMQSQAGTLQKRLAGVGTEAEGAGAMGARAFGVWGVAAYTGYQALQKIGDALAVTGDRATTTEGQFRNAGAALTHFDLIGAVLAFNVSKQADSWEEAKKQLDDYSASNRSWLHEATRSTKGVRDFLDQMGELVGLDPKLERLTSQFEKLWAAAHPPTDIDFGAISSLGGFRSGFGITPLDPTLGKGGPTRPGVTATQRNRFFDNRIARELDRVQDIKTVSGQVGTLRAIAAEIQKRIDATKDVTRRLNLEDQLRAVQRRAEGLQLGAQQAAKDAADKAAQLEKDRLQKLREAADARRQARQYVAIGLGPDGGDVIPRVANLQKQLAAINARTDIASLSNPLKKRLDGVAKTLKGGWGKVTSDTRAAIQDLFDAIRDELNAGASGGPLTKTTQLSERILAGLGLSAKDAAELKARIANFNSAGVALAGTGTQSSVNLTSYTVIDGRVVASTAGKYDRRTKSVNTAQRNGPNAGGWTGRG